MPRFRLLPELKSAHQSIGEAVNLMLFSKRLMLSMIAINDAGLLSLRNKPRQGF